MEDGSSGPDLRRPAVAAALRRYWRANIAIMLTLLVIWAAAGLGAGVIFADALNQWSIGGIPLGFWFAQQGSIIIFVVLILIYCVAMNSLDKKHHRELSKLRDDVRNGEGI